MNDYSIKLTYTPIEWELLDQMCRKKGSPNFRAYLNNRLVTLAKVTPTFCPPIENKKSANFIIPPDICSTIIEFARHRNIPVASLVRWFISDPVLKEFYEVKKPYAAAGS